MKKSFKRYSYICFLILFSIVLSQNIYGLQIAVNPATINVNNMVQNGYYEARYIISTTDTEPKLIEFKMDNSTIKDWITFNVENNSFYISNGNPQELIMYIRPPANIPNGQYSGKLYFHIRQKAIIPGVQTGSVVEPGVLSKINIDITGEQIQNCKVISSKINDIEIYEDIQYTLNIYNNGNVDITPNIDYSIYNKDNKKVLEGNYQDLTIRPSLREKAIINIPNELKQGQYFIRLDINNCQDHNDYKTFDILDYGEISTDLDFIFMRPVNIWNHIGDNIKINFRVQNTGEKVIREAYFKGQIELNDQIIEEIESEKYRIDPGQTLNFNHYFTPNLAGRFQIVGKMHYDGKVTFEKKNPINVNPKESEKKGSETSYNFIIILLIIAIIFMFLLLKKKKKQKHKTHKRLKK